ncbi:MAG: alpha-galactosidase [Clostridia bacterium]|nr:alpha-galactosidase [Clostridia bacterium]
MNTFTFGALTFTVTDSGIVALTKYYGFDNTERLNNPRALAFMEFDVAGGTSSGSYRMGSSLETAKLRYVRHDIKENVLTIVQKSDSFEVTSCFTMYDDTNAIRVKHLIKNISDEEVCLEAATSLRLRFGKKLEEDKNAYFFHKFNNSRYTEAHPDVRSLNDLGFQWENGTFFVSNTGNASAYPSLPQGIVENRRDGEFLMFQIESYTSWVYQIDPAFNLHLSGFNARHHNWNKYLAPGESYETATVAIASGKTLNSVLAEMTSYRRHIKPKSKADENLPAIYNEYMHYSWDDPNAERVKLTAPFVAKAGCKYYVVDCGWHDSKEITGPMGMYPKFGTWFEDLTRFPDGIRAVTEYVRSLGMKFGLWIGPEVVGVDNEKMLSYYGDDCFFIRNGKKIRHGTGYLLDFRNKKVYDYMSKTLDRMIDEYGCDYIKYDGCPNPGCGTELDSTSLGDGLEKAYEAFLNWTIDAMHRHPDVIFEDCYGGGNRMDYKALSIFHLISTSDQTDYLTYPYISANVAASVLPEQAAVWSYPVAIDVYNKAPGPGVNELVPKERVVMNMINSLLGRIHLASRIHLLDEEKQALIKEGIEVYDRITPDKLKSTPYLPKGYAAYGDTFVASGLKTDEKVYLALWNLKGERHIHLPLPEITVKNVKVIYPESLDTKFSFDSSSLTIDFTEDIQARFFEIEI